MYRSEHMKAGYRQHVAGANTFSKISPVPCVSGLESLLIFFPFFFSLFFSCFFEFLDVVCEGSISNFIGGDRVKDMDV
jgi:hypothetical protein